MKSLPEVLSYLLSKYKLNLKNPLTKKNKKNKNYLEPRQTLMTEFSCKNN